MSTLVDAMTEHWGLTLYVIGWFYSAMKAPQWYDDGRGFDDPPWGASLRNLLIAACLASLWPLLLSAYLYGAGEALADRINLARAEATMLAVRKAQQRRREAAKEREAHEKAETKAFHLRIVDVCDD